MQLLEVCLRSAYFHVGETFLQQLWEYASCRKIFVEHYETDF